MWETQLGFLMAWESSRLNLLLLTGRAALSVPGMGGGERKKVRDREAEKVVENSGGESKMKR